MSHVRGMVTRGGTMHPSALIGDSLIWHLRAAEVAAIPGGGAVTEGGASGDTAALSRATARMVRTIRIGRVLTGLFLILHGIAHARAGTVLTDPERSWRLFDGTVLGTIMVSITGILWAMSMLGFVAGGLGLLGVVGLRRYSRRLVFIAAISSVLLLALAAKPYALAGTVIDVALFVLLGLTEARLLRGRWVWNRTLIEEAAASAPARTRAHAVARASRNIVGWAFLLYVAVLVGMRPWHLTWGATDADLAMALPGDGLGARVAATHAVTIDAPASAVWPWLVQIGQDRGGFYSYSAIENGLLGAGIRNTDRIHPEWQVLRVGDFVRSARPDWLGGRFAGKTGWWVVDVQPQRTLTLMGWGTFALRPIDSATTRLVVRTRGGDGGFFSAPLDVLVLEPGHFLMERRMLLGIKERAEAAAGTGRPWTGKEP